MNRADLDGLVRNPDFQGANLEALYCKVCGKLALMTNQSLENLFTRDFDSSYIIPVTQDNEIYINKKDLKRESQSVFIKRDKDMCEEQIRYGCSECQNMICYEVVGQDMEKLPKVKNVVFVPEDSVVQNPQ